VGGEQLAGCGVDDVDGGVIDEDQHWCAGVAGADAEAVQLPGPSRGELAEAVDGVDADPVVGGVVADGGGRGFDCAVVGGGGGLGVCAVPAVVVAGVGELVELLLQVGDGPGGGLGG
jgi:hypothetical protein